MKKFWYALIDSYLAIKRWFWVLAGSGLWFETNPGALFIEVAHRGSQKKIRIATEKLAMAIQNIKKGPHGSAFVFKQGGHWTLVPDFLVPDLLAYLVTAHEALLRSRGQADVSPIESKHAMNVHPQKTGPTNTVN